MALLVICFSRPHKAKLAPRSNSLHHFLNSEALHTVWLCRSPCYMQEMWISFGKVFCFHSIFRPCAGPPWHAAFVLLWVLRECDESAIGYRFMCCVAAVDWINRLLDCFFPLHLLWLWFVFIFSDHRGVDQGFDGIGMALMIGSARRYDRCRHRRCRRKPVATGEKIALSSKDNDRYLIDRSDCQ